MFILSLSLICGERDVFLLCQQWCDSSRSLLQASCEALVLEWADKVLAATDATVPVAEIKTEATDDKLSTNGNKSNNSTGDTKPIKKATNSSSAKKSKNNNNSSNNISSTERGK